MVDDFGFVLLHSSELTPHHQNTKARNRKSGRSMANQEKWDVVVVGAGPGGCVSAKKCAQGGLSTLLLEKRKLPRDKVCTGMIMGPWAKGIVEQEFGKIPFDILTDPFYLKGIMLHIPGAESKTVANAMPIGWRRDIDYWMCQKAVEAGAELRDRAKVTGVGLSDTGYEVAVQRGQETDRYRARFVIGANGADAAIRKFIFPDYRTKARAAFRQCYQAQLTLDKYYFHWFFPYVSPSPRFDVIHKGPFFLTEGGGIKKLAGEIREILKDYGFDPESRPLWRDGCLMLPLSYDLFKGQFGPAKDNILLVGDAGGFGIPFTVEGVGPALKSGCLAAEAVLEAVSLGRKADGIYAKKIEGIIDILQHLRSVEKRMKDAAAQGPEALARAMAGFIEESFRVCADSA